MKVIVEAKKIFAKTAFTARKKSPELLLIAGIGSVIAGTVMVVRASHKAEPVFDEHKTTVTEARSRKEDLEAQYAEHIKDEDADPSELEKLEVAIKETKHDITIAYAHTAVSIVKVYAPAIAIETLGLVMIVYSHKIMSDRVAGLGSALTAANAALTDYRNNVKERYGEEVDREMRYGIKEVTKEVTETDENGNEVTTTVTEKTGPTITPGSHNWFYIFDSSSKEWEDDPAANLSFLKNKENWANRVIRERARDGGGRGFLFLNEVLQVLFPGERLEKRGQMIGWVYDEENPVGDNYIDFGVLWKGVGEMSEAHRRFLMGFEPNVMLDFNCDGNVYDLM